MKYKVGDKVKIKSFDWWYINNVFDDNNGEKCISCGNYIFIRDMTDYCGKIVTIEVVNESKGYYKIFEDEKHWYWTDEMIECKVEEETKPHNNMCKQLIDEMNPNVEVNVKVKTEPETTCEGKKRCVVYFWDNDFADKVELDLSNRELIQEDGKWSVVKKKKEYPKTYEECCEIVKVGKEHTLEGATIRINYKIALLESFQKLLICRDAYWKVAGEEMGLGKPWEPDWSTENEIKYVIEIYRNNVRKNSQGYSNTTLAFPTAEMRDAFKENFDPDIEFCKELL